MSFGKEIPITKYQDILLANEFARVYTPLSCFDNPMGLKQRKTGIQTILKKQMTVN